MGLKEHLVFPEINYDQIEQIWGMDIIVCTTAKTDRGSQARSSKEFQFPFARTKSGQGSTPWPRKAPLTVIELVKAPRQAVRRQARRAEGDRQRREPAAGRTLRSPPEAGRSCRATRRLDPHPQPLRSDRPSARLLSQAEDEPDCPARPGFARADPRPRQVELVGEGPDVDERSPERYDRPHQERRRRASAPRSSTPASKLRARVLDVLADEGYIRGYALVEKPGAFPNSRSS